MSMALLRLRVDTAWWLPKPQSLPVTEGAVAPTMGPTSTPLFSSADIFAEEERPPATTTDMPRFARSSETVDRCMAEPRAGGETAPALPAPLFASPLMDATALPRAGGKVELCWICVATPLLALSCERGRPSPGLAAPRQSLALVPATVAALPLGVWMF